MVFNTMKTKNYHTVGTATKWNKNIVERGKMYTPKTHIYITSQCPVLLQTLQ